MTTPPPLTSTVALPPPRWRVGPRRAGWRHAAGRVRSAVTVAVALLFLLVTAGALVDAARALPRGDTPA